MTEDGASAAATGDGDNGSNGGNPPAWAAQLPDDLKGNETLTGFATIGDLGKSFIDLHGKSERALFIPGEDATDEDRATFYNRLGRPETPDGYEFQMPDLPEGLPYDKARETEFKKVMHDLGIPKETGEKLFKHYADDAVKGFNDLQQKRTQYHDEQVKALQTEWGNDYTANAEAAMAAAQAHGGETFTKFLEDSGLGDNPMLVKVFHSVAAEINRLKGLIGEDLLITGDRSGTGEKGDPAADIYPDMKQKSGG